MIASESFRSPYGPASMRRGYQRAILYETTCLLGEVRPALDMLLGEMEHQPQALRDAIARDVRAFVLANRSDLVVLRLHVIPGKQQIIVELTGRQAVGMTIDPDPSAKLSYEVEQYGGRLDPLAR